MAETMVRTQVYLPRAVYEKLRQRAEKHGLTMAEQIREALEDYLRHSNNKDEEPILEPSDPIFDLIRLAGEGPEDGAENHDKYLYDDPHHEKVSRPFQIEMASKRVVRERSVKYRAKPRRTKRQKKGRQR